MWRTLMPADGVVIACDGDDVVGMAYYLDLRLTVPGGAVLPMAGVSWVCVAPTHRRRGVLREMFAELHRRMAWRTIRSPDSRRPRAASTVGSATARRRVVESLSVDRREAGFLDDVPDPAASGSSRRRAPRSI